MSVVRIASRYAKSLLDLAIEQDKLDRILEDVHSFKKATENRDFYLLLKSPIVNATKKKSIFEALFKDKYDPMTSSFLNILLSKGRETYLPEIAASFLDQYKRMKKISSISLTTAKALSESNVAAIKNKLEASDQTSDVIDLETKVDKELIGGFIIEFDDKLYDASVAHKLEQLRKEFKDDPYEVKI